MASPVRKQTMLSEKMKIIDLHKSGMSISAIANDVGQSESVVHEIITPNKKSNTPESPKKFGRPRITTKREDRTIIRISMIDRFKTASEISWELDEYSDLQVSRQTVSRRLFEADLKSRFPAFKPLISRKNQKARLQYATEHVLWTPEQWEQVHLISDDSDESEYNLRVSDGKKTVRCMADKRLVPQYVKASLKFGGGSMMVGGIISALVLAFWFVYLTS